MLTWNFINSQQTFMYISIFFVVFIILGVKKKISNSTITKQACPWTHNLRHHHPNWFPLSSSPAPRTSPAVPAEHGLLPLPPPQHQPPHTSSHPGSPFLSLPISLLCPLQRTPSTEARALQTELLTRFLHLWHMFICSFMSPLPPLLHTYTTQNPQTHSVPSMHCHRW